MDFVVPAAFDGILDGLIIVFHEAPDEVNPGVMLDIDDFRVVHSGHFIDLLSNCHIEGHRGKPHIGLILQSIRSGASLIDDAMLEGPDTGLFTALALVRQDRPASY